MKFLESLKFKKKPALAEEKKPTEVERSPSARAREGTNVHHRTSSILLRPVVTEKASALASQHTYVFLVPTSAGKIEIKKAVKAQYHVTPISVNILRRVGKVVRYAKTTGRTTGEKKAIVTLKAGDRIELPHVL